MDKIRTNRFWLFFTYHFNKKLLSLIVLTLIIITGVAAGSINPFVYGKIIDAIGIKQLESVSMYIILYFFVNLSASLLGLLESYIGRIITYHISSSVKREVFTKIIRMRFKNLEKYTVGELISRLDSDADNVVGYYIDLITNISMVAFNLIASAYFIFTISARLSIISILYIPASTMVNIIFRKKLRELEKKQRLFNDKYMSFINEAFTNIRALRAYQLENASDEKFRGFIGKNLTLIKKSIRLRNTMTILSRIISSLFYLAILFFSAKFIIEGTLTIGSMVAFNMYMGKLYDAVSRIMTMNMNAQSVIVSMDRIDKLQNEPDEQPFYKDTASIHGHITGININRLNFSYKDDLVIQNLSMQCEGPGLYAIVGKNGSGKSTLFKILMGFYDYDGQVFFTKDYGQKNYSLTDIGLLSLRSKIIYISKDVFILNDTLLNNLSIANPELTENDIIEICNEIGFNAFVDSLPDRYETTLTENGSNFSSGQKQKLNAVRAYLSRSDIILLDEITSDLDGISEMEIISLIKDLSKTRIVLFISHKVTSIIDSKRIFLFNKGHITDNGSYDEMMTRSELFRELFWLEKSSQ